MGRADKARIRTKAYKAFKEKQKENVVERKTNDTLSHRAGILLWDIEKNQLIPSKFAEAITILELRLEETKSDYEKIKIRHALNRIR